MKLEWGRETGVWEDHEDEREKETKKNGRVDCGNGDSGGGVVGGSSSSGGGTDGAGSVP